MIEVKGTRVAQQATDPTDPLSVRKPTESGAGVITGIVAGILGLAVYLRSFLWFEPSAAQAAGMPEKAPDDVSGGATPKAPRSFASAEPASADKSANDPAGPDGGAAATLTTPIVFGPFETGIFAPEMGATKAGIPQNSPANSSLPPFDFSFGRKGASAPDAATSNAPTSFSATTPDAAPGASDEAESDTDDEDSVVITQPHNRAPRNSGPVYLGDVGSGATLAMALSHLLANSSDPDSDNLTVTMGSSSSGSVEPRNGNWRYLAGTEELGEVQITYQVTDGTLGTTQSAIINVVENQFFGTEDADLLLGTEGRDRIDAVGGDDNIAAFGGHDVVFGGAGDDNIAGGAGRDSLFGGDGDDIIAGGADGDWISGGAGDDQLFGEAGDDELWGDAGNDLLDGGTGHDTLAGGEGDDTLIAGDGQDLLSGGAGDDVLHGEADADVLFGDDGQDQLFGGSGEDLIFGGNDADLLDGGIGHDILVGGLGEDTILGGDGDDLAAGGDGNDLIKGGAGNDRLEGELGDDLLLGEEGNDVLSGGAGEDTLSGGLGDDVIFLDSDFANDLLFGGEGYDVLQASAETLGLEINLILGSVVSETTGEDSFSEFEAFVGSFGDDTFIAAGGEATFTGNGGADLYKFVQGDVIEQPMAHFRVTDFGTDDLLTFSNSIAGVNVRRAQRDLESNLEDFFEDFAERFGADEPKLRYFHEWSEDYRRTVVEVDFDRDNLVDMSLVLDGEYALDFSQT